MTMNYGYIMMPDMTEKPCTRANSIVTMQVRTGYTRADQLTIQTDAPAKRRWKLWVEVLVTTAILTIVWGLLSLPSVFYFLPQNGVGVPKDNQVRHVRAQSY